MRASRRGAVLVALTLSLLVAAAPGVRADELLVMPYSCTMVGGQPVLSPGPEQSHRIIGQRDQRKFSACSPVNPSMCRQWTVHRFDLECDGARVSWVSVVAASNEGSRRAWLLDGRLVLRMGPWWSLAPDDPCAREGGGDERLGGGRMRRQCAERLATAPPPVVEMPFGYAPMLGVDGIIVTAAPPIGGGPPGALPPIVAAPPPAKSAAGDAPSYGGGPPATLPPIIAAPGPKVPGAEEMPPLPSARETLAKEPPVKVGPAREPVVKEALARELAAKEPPSKEPPAKEAAAKEATGRPSAAPQNAAPPPNMGPRVATTATPHPVAPAPAEAAPKTAVPAKAEPKAAAPAQAPLTNPAPKDAGPRDAAPPVSEVRKTAAAADPQPAASSPTAPAAGDGRSPGAIEPESGFSLLGAFRATTTGAIVTFAGLAMGLLTAFALARRREHARDAVLRRDIAAKSLDGRRMRPPRGPEPELRGRPAAAALRQEGGAGQAQKPGQSHAQKQAQSYGQKPAHAQVPGPNLAPPSPVADWGDRMPHTREEALEVLGIGIAPSATETAIKKIVDGLRMSWHPDLATDETDRALRELRSKQINAAWEILQGQRAEA